MATLNAPAVAKARTHEGGKASDVSPLLALRRSVLTCLLWEDDYYEKGAEKGARIVTLVKQCNPSDVAALAVEARTTMQLRHVPLLLVRELVRVKENAKLAEDTLRAVVQRPDEITEFLAIYFAGGRAPIPHGIRRALAHAFGAFSRYQIAKYKDDDKKIKLRDALRLVHPKAKDDEQNETFRQLRKGELAPAETWESELSAGKDKRETFERLIREKKLGALACLRNLRNMQQFGVADALIRERLAGPMPHVWPYRYVAAAKYAPTLEDALEQAMYRSVSEMLTLPGKTGLLIDVSGSMDDALSSRAQRASTASVDATSRVDVAAGLAILLREKAEQVQIATFSSHLALVPPRRGFALRDAIKNSQPHESTHLKAALVALRRQWDGLDRLIVITDEQSQDGIAPAWLPQSYIINVASYAHGVGYHAGYQHIQGWSERVFDYIAAVESAA